MKIIGQTSTGFIFEGNSRELAHVMGISVTSVKFYNLKLESGFEFQVENDYVRSKRELKANKFLRGTSIKDLTNMKNNIDATIDDLIASKNKIDRVIDTTKKVQIFETIQEAGDKT